MLWAATSSPALRPLLAWLLLLCLLRTLLPEAWVIAWHPHQHTTHEPAFAARHQPAGKLYLTARHQHCHAEQFYNVPFVAAVCVVIPLPITRPHYQQTGSADIPLVQLKAVRMLANRGPPVA